MLKIILGRAHVSRREYDFMLLIAGRDLISSHKRSGIIYLTLAHLKTSDSTLLIQPPTPPLYAMQWLINGTHFYIYSIKNDRIFSIDVTPWRTSTPLTVLIILTTNNSLYLYNIPLFMSVSWDSAIHTIVCIKLKKANHPLHTPMGTN